MSCQIKYNNGKLEVSAPNGAPSLLFEKSKFTIDNNKEFSSKITGTFEEKSIKLWSKLSSNEDLPKDMNGEPDYKINVLDNSNLVIDNLWSVLSSMGVKRGAVSTYSKQFEQQNGYALDVQGVADPINKIIAWNNGDKATQLEEMSHMMTSTMLEDPTFKRILSIVDQHPEFNEIYNKYIKVPGYTDQLARKEVVDKLIRDVLLDNDMESTSSRILRTIRTLIRKALKFFDNKLIEDFANDLKDKIKNKELKLSDDFKGNVQYEIKSSEFKDFDLSHQVDSLLKELNEAKKNQTNKTIKKEITKKIEQLELPQSAGNYKTATVNALNSTSLALDDALDILNTLDKSENKTEEIVDALRRAKEKVAQFNLFIEDINSEKSVRRMPDRVKTEVSDIVSKKARYEGLIRNKEIELSERLMSPFTKLMTHFKEGEYKKLLEEVKNISGIQAWIQSLANLNDDVLKLFDLYYKRSRQIVINKSKDEAEELLRLRSKIEDFNDLDFIQKDAEGNISRYFVNPENINFAEYEITRKKAMREIRVSLRLSENYDERKKQLGEDPELSKMYRENKDNWFKNNQERLPNLDQVIKNQIEQSVRDIFSVSKSDLVEALYKFISSKGYVIDNYSTREFLKTYDKKLSLGEQEKIDTVIYGVGSYILDNSFKNNGDLIFTKDLATPRKDLYEDLSYDKLPDSKKSYLDQVLKIKAKSSKLPLNPAHLYKLPQLTKSLAQLLKEGNVKGLQQNFMDKFRFNDEEIVYDSNTRTLPVYFINEIENINDMSTDIHMLTNSFGYMANHYIEMRNIESSILMMEGVINKRRILDSPGLIGGNQAERITDYIDANIYGKFKKNEGKTGKILDFLGAYTSLLGLGYNIYSPPANVLQAYSSIAQEKAAKIYDKESFAKADSFYTTHLMESLRAFDNPSVDSTLTGLGRLFNVRDEFMQQVIKESPNESVAIKRILSSPYALNNIGEHFGAYKMALTIIANKKVLYKGEKVSLLDHIDHKDFSSSISEDVTELDGSPVDVDAISLKIHSVNQRLFGIYNKVDQSRMQHFALGRMLKTFRKFIISPGNRRYGKLEYNYQEGLDDDGNTIKQEGMYRSMLRIYQDAKQLAREDKEMLLSGAFKEKWAKMDDVQRQNYLRIRRELATVLGAFTIYLLLTNIVDEDDEDLANQLLAFTAYQANRHITEMSFFFNPVQTLEILRSPAAAVSAIEKFITFPVVLDPIQFFTEGNPFRKYQDGSYYIGKKTIDIIPIVKGIRNATNIMELYNLSSR
jgi:hypothetical protein